MEIISYVLAGNLAHKDSMGNVKGIPPGDVQRMSAGSGVQHSEFNHAPDATTHFLQIWIEPSVSGIAPSYEQKSFVEARKLGKLCLLASPDGALGSLTINADARLYAALLGGEQTAELVLASNRKAYVHLIRGEVSVNGVALTAGDATLLDGEPLIELTRAKDAEVLVFDLQA
jgi:redox-sensitive bicupin YhaK (pirin superfamily)